MVLIRRFALPLVVLAGCSESLFDAHGPGTGGGNGSDGGMVASSCPSPCLADVAANFDGTAGGMGNHWRYLDDHRDRTWAPMTTAAASMTGGDPGNHITTCAAKPGAAACQMLPGALLVSSAGSASAADPAVEFTAKTNQVVQISVRVAVPSGDEQQIRIYRNSREDVLYTGTAFPGAVLEQPVTLDAIAGDRFLVAVAPTVGGATDVGLHVYVNATNASFPSTCQIALPFTAANGNAVDNVCGSDFTYQRYSDDAPMPPVLVNDGPFPELGNVASISPGMYFPGTGTLDETRDTTWQFWVKLRTPVTSETAWIFSDVDVDNAGGMQIGLYKSELDVSTVTSATPTTLNFAGAAPTYPNPMGGSWQFVRVVYAGKNVRICVNGSFATSFALPDGLHQTQRSPNLAKAAFRETPSTPVFDGEIDDLRMMNVALPCN